MRRPIAVTVATLVSVLLLAGPTAASAAESPEQINAAVNGWGYIAHDHDGVPTGLGLRFFDFEACSSSTIPSDCDVFFECLTDEMIAVDPVRLATGEPTGAYAFEAACPLAGSYRIDNGEWETLRSGAVRLVITGIYEQTTYWTPQGKPLSLRFEGVDGERIGSGSMVIQPYLDYWVTPGVVSVDLTGTT